MKSLKWWAYFKRVKVTWTDKPTDNAFIESFNGIFRQKRLEQKWFSSLGDVQHLIEARREIRTSIGSATPSAATPVEVAISSKAAGSLEDIVCLTSQWFNVGL